MKEKLLIAATKKEYTIDLDGKPFVVKNEKLMGVIDPFSKDVYFSGMVIALHKTNGWQFETTQVMTREEFDESVSSWKEVL